MTSAEDVPTLNAYRGGNHLFVWCAPEGRWHQHGACGVRCRWGKAYYIEHTRIPGSCECPPGSADGHRSPHCDLNSGSPYIPYGYELREVGLFTVEVERAYRHERR